MNWLDARESNGMGWLSDCGNYAIRECIYKDGTPTDYWCYYKVLPEDTKFMRVYGGVKSSLELAKQHIIDFIKTRETISNIRRIDPNIADELEKVLS